MLRCWYIKLWFCVTLYSNCSALWQNYCIITCSIMYLLFHHIFQLMSCCCCIWAFGCCDIQFLSIYFLWKGLKVSQLWCVTCPAIWDHTMLSATRHKYPTLTAARQVGTRFTYPKGMEGWVELCDRWHNRMMYVHTSTNQV